MTKQEKITATHGNIAAALAAAQMEMGNASKDSNNPHFKSKYADLKSVRDAALPPLNKHGIAVSQPMESTEFGHSVKTVFIHAESGEHLETSVPLLMGRQDMQGLGAAITYARRYGLMSLAGIAPAEDDDGNGNRVGAEFGAAIADTWKQGVLDSLPENATQIQKARAFTDAIIADFVGKGERALRNRYERHKGIIQSLDGRFPDLYGEVIAAYETYMQDATSENGEEKQNA